MNNIKEINIKTKITEQHMYAYLMHFNYSGFSGIRILLFSCFSLFVFVSSFFWNDNFITIIALFGLLLYTFFTPLSLRLKAKRQILLNQAYKNPFEYNFSKQGLTIAQGPNKAKYSWEDFYKIKETKKVLLFFISKKVAFILPLESCDNKSYEGIIELIKDFENKKLVNIKKVQGKI